MYPFRFANKTYNSCTPDHDPDGNEWCSTREEEKEEGEFPQISFQCNYEKNCFFFGKFPLPRGFL